MDAVLIEWDSAGAGTRAKHQKKPKAMEEENPKVGRGDGYILIGKQNREGSCAVWSETSSTREAGVRTARCISSVLITGDGSSPLPPAQAVRGLVATGAQVGLAPGSLLPN